MKTRNITTFAAVAAACLAGSSAYAGTRSYAPSKPVKETISESCITGDIGFDVVSEYVSKGIVFENQGFIIQPYADLHFRLYKGPGPIDSITADIGIWNSMQSKRTFAPPGSTTANWFEFDFQTGLTLNIDKLSISPYFKTYESPSDSFRTAYTTGIAASYDDKTLLGDFALHPHVLVELELEGTTGNNIKGPHAGTGGQYYEVGIAPARSFGDITLTLPVTAGFGSGHFYNKGRGYGYASIGLDGSYAMNFVPSCLGKWAVHTGFTYYHLGGGAASVVPAQFDPNSGRTKGDRDQFVFSGGLKVAF